MTDINKRLIDGIETYLEKNVNAKKAGLVCGWIEKLLYCMDHCDEAEYGRDLVLNIMLYLGMTEGKRVNIDDRVVTNTEYVLCAELHEMLGGRRSKLQDIVKVDEAETVMPGARWEWRGYRSYVKRNKHSHTIQFVCEDNAAQQDREVMMEKIMEAMVN